MPAQTYVTIIALAMVPLGCSNPEGQPPSLSPPAAPNKPEISLAVLPPADPENVKPGSLLDITCKIAEEPGKFEPLIVTFQVSDSKNKHKVLDATTISDSERLDNNLVFSHQCHAPQTPGRYTIDAKISGLDPSVPATGPKPAPPANGTSARVGARAEFNAPSLEIKVKK